MHANIKSNNITIQGKTTYATTATSTTDPTTPMAALKAITPFGGKSPVYYKIWVTVNRIARKDSMTTNHASTLTANPSGPKSMLPIPTQHQFQTMTSSIRFFSMQSSMTPLINVPSVISQLILNFCTVSIATFKKLFNKQTPFNGDKI
jgi:hypothetical protein